MTWLSRFGLHLAAAVGATGVLLVATTVGAMQTREAVSARSTATAVTRAGLVGDRGARPAVTATPAANADGGGGETAPPPGVAPTQAPAPAGRPPAASLSRAGGPPGGPVPAGGPASGTQTGPGPTQPGAAIPRPGPLLRQHSVTGAIVEVSGSDLTIRTPAGREGVIRVAPKAIVRLGGKPVDLEQLQPGDRIVAVGQQVQEDELRVVAVLARRPPAR